MLYVGSTLWSVLRCGLGVQDDTQLGLVDLFCLYQVVIMIASGITASLSLKVTNALGLALIGYNHCPHHTSTTEDLHSSLCTQRLSYMPPIFVESQNFYSLYEQDFHSHRVLKLLSALRVCPVHRRQKPFQRPLSQSIPS